MDLPPRPGRGWWKGLATMGNLHGEALRSRRKAVPRRDPW